MYLKRISLVNFKNYREFEADFSEKINCFVGGNGIGKTNLLDAIHYLSFCKSFFNPVDSQNIRHEEGFFVIQGVFDRNGEQSEVYCGIKRNQKKVFKKNKKEYDRLSGHIGQFPLVMISPDDSELVNGHSEIRRRFLDGIISQYDKSYLEQLISYNQVLKQRNALLRQNSGGSVFDADTLDILDVQLAAYGGPISGRRSEFLLEFSPIFNRYYTYLSNSRETASLLYQSSTGNSDLRQALLASLPRDRALQYTGVGPHKDDLQFQLDGFSLKKFASQGQQKSYLLALRLAQFEFLREKKKTNPLLLLDDVYDKLDEERFSRLLDMVSGERFGQVFITDTHPERMEKLLNGKSIVNRIFTSGEDLAVRNLPANEEYRNPERVDQT